MTTLRIKSELEERVCFALAIFLFLGGVVATDIERTLVGCADPSRRG